MSCFAEWSREKDPVLYDIQSGKLLELGWGGELTSAEYDYIRRHLEQDPLLRSRWGFHRKKGWKLSEELIRRRALWGE